MKEHHVDGTDKIKLVQFIIIVFTEADKMKMSKGNACLAFLKYRNGVQIPFLVTKVSIVGRKQFTSSFEGFKPQSSFLKCW